jgi:CheY-like chemotaxis protein
MPDRKLARSDRYLRFRPTCEKSATVREFGFRARIVAQQARLDNREFDMNDQSLPIAEYSLAIPPLDDHPLGSNGPRRDNLQVAATSSPGHEKPRCRVLLAENDVGDQHAATLLLRQAGCGTTVADNGQTALILALSAERSGKGFDLILMAMTMPVMDGYEAALKLRKANFKRPIIAVADIARWGDRRKWIEAGCDDCISKPIDAKRLSALLEAWAGKPQVGDGVSF